MPNTLLLVYPDLLGDYMLFRHALRAALPGIKSRFTSMVWCCNPGVAKLSAVLDPDWQDFIQFAPVDLSDWTRLTLKRIPKFLLNRKRHLAHLQTNHIPNQVMEVWCPSMVPFEINTINALVKANRKMSRRLQSVNLDLLQHLLFTETFLPTDFNQFVMYQHVGFFEQALHTAISIPPEAQKAVQLNGHCNQANLTRQLNNRPYMVIFPESAGVYKEWAPEKFAQLINLLLANHPQLTVVLSGQRTEVGNRIMALINPDNAVIDATGKTTVLESLGLIDQSELVVCNDSFALHAANALARPVVCIATGQFEGRYYPYPLSMQLSEHHFVMPLHPGGTLDTIEPQQVLTSINLLVNKAVKQKHVV